MRSRPGCAAMTSMATSNEAAPGILETEQPGGSGCLSRAAVPQPGFGRVPKRAEGLNSLGVTPRVVARSVDNAGRVRGRLELR
jgi:hypothetical protein